MFVKVLLALFVGTKLKTLFLGILLRGWKVVFNTHLKNHLISKTCLCLGDLTSSPCTFHPFFVFVFKALPQFVLVMVAFVCAAVLDGKIGKILVPLPFLLYFFKTVC
uniref:Uncharacterized protein n=1 Tax=Pyxicephalus adspersus TaxID=30357 RepID=A0AAV3AUC4_PYXAD|nr:TPA: hypothetical protein GDO54_009349 [Pyxicephalus adspersus]